MITEGVESVISHPGVDVPAEEVCTISAHRVVVAARCDWFRRALLSGMREAIDRLVVEIFVYDFIISLETYTGWTNNRHLLL